MVFINGITTHLLTGMILQVIAMVSNPFYKNQLGHLEGEQPHLGDLLTGMILQVTTYPIILGRSFKFPCAALRW